MVMLDTDRMTGGKELAAKLRQGKRGGIPWFVILDGDGNEKITSDGPKGNCGCPAQPHEIDHFMAMIDKTRQHMSDVDRAIIERELRIYGAGLTARDIPGRREYSPVTTSVKRGDFAGALTRLDVALGKGYPATRIPSDPALFPLREDPASRELLRLLVGKHVQGHEVTLVDPLEPGERIRLRGRVVDSSDRPIAGAMVELFHTDAGGEYRPGMVAGGGAGNPRIIGAIRTAKDGTFVVDTVYPNRYPDSTVPRHIHYKVYAQDHAELVSECFFDADPLLTNKTRASAPSRNFPIVKFATDAEHRKSADLLIRLPR